MIRYRKKPVVIDAFLYADPGPNTCHDLDTWLDHWHEENDDRAAMWQTDDGSIVIPTLEGDMRCSVGDCIIRGVQGEFYPCKPDIFDATYEPVVEK